MLVFEIFVDIMSFLFILIEAMLPAVIILFIFYAVVCFGWQMIRLIFRF